MCLFVAVNLFEADLIFFSVDELIGAEIVSQPLD